MIINHNLNAINTYNKFNKANISKCKSMEKISSGMRINKAADDAAGLSISEKMKAQIRGLEQSSMNIQNGISLIQTTEGALGEIENPYLQRMRELCIQAANGTLTDDDRKKIQSEIDQIKNGIDDIANNTEFNNIKVLRPPIYEIPPVSSGKADIVFIIDRTGSMGTPITNVKNNIETFANELQSKHIDTRFGLVTYGEVNDKEPIIKKDFTSDTDTFKGYMEKISVSGGGDVEESGLEGIKDGALNYSFREDVSKHLILVTDAPVHDSSSDGDGGDGKSKYDIDDLANELRSNNIKLSVVSQSSGHIYDQLKRLSDPTNGSYLNISGDFSSQLSSLASAIVDDSGKTIEEDEMPILKLQVGTNSGNEFSIELLDARTPNLGIDHVIIDPIEKAQEAINKIDAAIEKTSSQRAKFGSYQNALEHISNNVLNYQENITAAESRIRDADMAKEVMEMTKNSILEQSAQALLKQAQDMPQSILNLMEKWGQN